MAKLEKKNDISSRVNTERYCCFAINCDESVTRILHPYIVCLWNFEMKKLPSIDPVKSCIEIKNIWVTHAGCFYYGRVKYWKTVGGSQVGSLVSSVVHLRGPPAWFYGLKPCMWFGFSVPTWLLGVLHRRPFHLMAASYRVVDQFNDQSWCFVKSSPLATWVMTLESKKMTATSSPSFLPLMAASWRAVERFNGGYL